MFVFFVYLLCLLFLFDFIKNLKETILCTTLVFSTVIVFITEILSLFQLLNFISVAVFWGSLSIILLYFLIKEKLITVKNLKIIKSTVINGFKLLKIYEKSLIVVIIAAFFALLFQGIIYPPNNWDSLTYHLSRIMYWLSNESVAHFPTHILRNLYQPPFAEYCIMHINLLNGNDYLSNSLQLFFLMFSTIAIWAVLDFFEISKFYKLLAVFLLITIPAVELQASSTKNDIVCGFFLITALYFALKTFYETKLKNYILLALAIGLGMFTKGTAYVFLAPILILFSIFMMYKLIKNKELTILSNGAIVISIVLLINAGHFFRNYQINQDILNIDETEAKMYSNSKMDSILFYSNLIKNVGLHVDNPFRLIYDDWIRDFHRANNININNPDTNFFGMPYNGALENQTHEDLVPNSIHLYLVCFFFITVFVSSIIKIKSTVKELLLLLMFVLQIILFVGYLKWQPWHIRLHIPIFMISIILIIVGANQIKWFKPFLFLSLPFLCYGFCFNFFYNNTRPVITNSKYTKNININDSRYKKYFSNQMHLYPEYSKISDLMENNSENKFGFILSDWEYPLLKDFYYQKPMIISINVYNNTNRIKQNENNIDCIINNQNVPFFNFGGLTYKNQTPTHKHIWFYKR